MNVVFRPQQLKVSAAPAELGVGFGDPIARDQVDREPYAGSYEIQPTEAVQILETAEKRMTDDLTVEAIPSDYVGSSIPRRSSADLQAAQDLVAVPAGYYPASAGKSVGTAEWSSGETYTENPSLDVDYDTGTISVAFDTTKNVKPLSKSGYADKSGSVPVRVKGNAATQLYTIGETAYTPSGSAQIIPAGRLLTGDQTIQAIAPPWYDMGGPLAFLGKGAELVGQNFYKKVDTLSNTGYNGWTPSTTAKACVASVTLSDAKFTATAVDQYAYFIVWECGIDIAYTGSPTLKALPTFGRALIVQNLIKRPDSWANIQAGNCNATVNQAALTSSFLRYYGTTTGSITYTWASSNGLYFTATAPTISNTTATAPTITPKAPVLNAKVSTTYMSTASANAIDQANTKWWILGSKIYRVKRDCFFDGIYKSLCDVINSAAPSA